MWQRHDLGLDRSLYMEEAINGTLNLGNCIHRNTQFWKQWTFKVTKNDVVWFVIAVLNLTKLYGIVATVNSTHLVGLIASRPSQTNTFPALLFHTTWCHCWCLFVANGEWHIIVLLLPLFASLFTFHSRQRHTSPTNCTSYIFQWNKNKWLILVDQEL